MPASSGPRHFPPWGLKHGVGDVDAVAAADDVEDVRDGEAEAVSFVPEHAGSMVVSRAAVASAAAGPRRV